MFRGLVLFVSILMLASSAYGQYSPGHIRVKFKPQVMEIPKGARAAAVGAATVRAASVRALNAKHGVVEVRQLYKDALEIRPDWTDLADQYIITFPKDKDVEKIAQDYKKDASVLEASPVGVMRAFATNPDDPYFQSGQQWGLTSIKAPQAWDRTTGSSSIVVAVLDTGINYNHTDFDKNNRIDMANAKDFVNGDNDPMDDFGHGTTVCGVIGAATNNAKGVAGVDWKCKILPIKVLDSNGEDLGGYVLDGLAWARAKGVDIINMSLGQYTPETELERQCRLCYEAGIVIVAAAGNGNVEYWNGNPAYPAGYPFVLSVAAVDQNDLRSVWGGIDPTTGKTQASNYGSWVDVSAPGTTIWSTHMDGAYGSSNGTSLATPFVAGLAALVKGMTGAASQELVNKITQEADNIDSLNPGFEKKLGSGRINAYKSLGGVAARITAPTDGSYVKGTVRIEGTASGEGFSSFLLEALKNNALVATIENGTAPVENGLINNWDTTGLNDEHAVRLRTFSVTGNSAESSVSIIIDNIAPDANITSPADGATVSGAVNIVGTANDKYFDHYLLEYGAGSSPTSFLQITAAYSTVEAGNLGAWQTSGLNGTYTLRLTAYDRVGASSVKSIALNLSNTGAPTREAEPQAGLPLTFILPNPFIRSGANSTTEVTFNYKLAGNFQAKIYLFDLGGNLVWQKSYSAGDNGGKSGSNNPGWDGRNLFGVSIANGVYLYHVVADGKTLAKGKIVVLN